MLVLFIFLATRRISLCLWRVEDSSSLFAAAEELHLERIFNEAYIYMILDKSNVCIV